MKTLLLMRHAKSSWKDDGLKDRKRPLSKRGQKNAPLMGELIKEKELVPQLILCSTAVRARQTAELVVAACGCTGEVRYLDELYMAEAEEIIAQIKQTPDEFERIMVIGHNPGLESVLPLLTRQVQSLPTAAVADLSLPINAWGELNKKVHAELIDVWRPKELD
jgi:phosphohistidine phosphatase